jgi:NADH dehydrogenase FAD-containing subunit
MGRHLVLIGGGHAHMTTLANLHRFIQRGHRVTVIGPSEHHYYSGMGPGMLSGIYTSRQIRFATRRVVEKQKGTFISGEVTHIDPEQRIIFTKNGDTYGYDVVSFNAGSFVPADMVRKKGDRIYAAKPIERLRLAQAKLIELAQNQKVRVSIVGGGAASMEIAGNTWRLLRDHQLHGFDIAVYTSGRLLDKFPKKVRIAGKRSLEGRSIRVNENCRIDEIKDGELRLASGKSVNNDLIFLATGVRPSSIFAQSGLPTGPDGGLAVNGYLQCTGYANIFGGGDCIYFENQPLDKVGVYAVRQNPILFHNLMAALEGSELKPFSPGGDYLLIFNTGDGKGILYKRGFLIGGRTAFYIKDYIDRRFMRKFQSIEEETPI